MAVSVRVIPCLDVDGGRVVKGVNFIGLRDAGDPVELASRYDAEGADELTFLDVSASSEGRATMVDVVGRTADVLFVPLTVGGGVRSVEDVDRLLRAGADKVGVNTAAIERPELIAEIAERFGSQVLVVSVDARRVVSVSGDDGGGAGLEGAKGGGDDRGGSNAAQTSTPSGFEVTTHGGRRGTGIDAVEWAVRAAELGAGEILLTSMDADGTENGFDLELLRAVRSEVSIPIVASGGAGTAQHFVDAALAGADAVLAASVFHFGQLTVGEVKDAMRAAGLEVR
jgi:cyclase